MKNIFIAFFLLFIQYSAHTQDTETDTAVFELIELTGVKAGIQSTFDLMMPQIEQETDSTKIEFWNRYKERFIGGQDQIIQQIAEIYKTNFTNAEILELIEFYKTPIGQKLLEKLPIITKESYNIGSKYGQALVQEILAEMKEEGYEVE